MGTARRAVRGCADATAWRPYLRRSATEAESEGESVGFPEEGTAIDREFLGWLWDVAAVKRIRTEADFQEFLGEEQAILFTYFGWSGPAQASLAIIEGWDRDWERLQPGLSPLLYRMDPDGCPFAWAWLAENVAGEESEAAFGSVRWVSSGKACFSVRYANRAGLDFLVKKTTELFGG